MLAYIHLSMYGLCAVYIGYVPIFACPIMMGREGGGVLYNSHLLNNAIIKCTSINKHDYILTAP